MESPDIDFYVYIHGCLCKRTKLFRLLVFVSFIFVIKKLIFIKMLDDFRETVDEDTLPRRITLTLKTYRLNNDMDNQIVNFFQIRNYSEIDPLVNLHRYKFLLSSQLCELTRPDIVVFVHTAIRNADRRNVIRNSWGKYTNLQNITITTLFMLGETNSTLEQLKLNTEAEIHGDIVQGNFIDSYWNLTYKHIMGLHWVLSRCPTAKLFVKLDDDVLLNVFNLVGYVTKFGYQSSLLYCTVLRKPGVFREKREKWYVSREVYPFEHYPDFCSGMAYLISPNVARRIYGASEDTRFYWVDDIYVTGLLAAKVNQSLTQVIEGYSSTRMKSYNRANMHDYLFLLGTQLWRVLWKALLRNTPDRLTRQVRDDNWLLELRKSQDDVKMMAK